jgi:hypothetical protein
LILKRQAIQGKLGHVFRELAILMQYLDWKMKKKTFSRNGCSARHSRATTWVCCLRCKVHISKTAYFYFWPSSRFILGRQKTVLFFYVSLT